MRQWIYVMACSAVLLLIGASFTAAAETVTDPTGDVWHWSNTGTAWSWIGNVANKPNIDITQVSGTVNGDKLTLSLTVAGTIQYSANVYYWAYYNTSDTSYYWYWANGTGIGMGSVQSGGYEYNANFTVSGSTINAVFNIIGSTTNATELWGWAAEYTLLGPGLTTHEWWGDWAPNSKIPFSTTTSGNHGNTTGGNNGNTTSGNNGNNTSGNNTGKKTPGFEVLPVIAAVAIAAILLRRRR